jgi:AraC-like DNA-binding protein
MRPIVQRLEAKGRDTALLLARHGIRRESLNDPYAILPMARYVSLFEDAADLVGDPLLGAHLGISFRPADIGPMGLLFSISATIADAFDHISKYVNSLQSATGSALFHEDGYLIWKYEISEASIWPRRQDSEYSLATICQLVRNCFSSRWRPIEVHFEHHAPSERHALQTIFGAPVYFGQSGNLLVIDAKEAATVYREEDRDLSGVLQRHIAELVDDGTDAPSLVQKVKSLIAINLGQRPLTLKSIADELSLPPRTLQRHLEREGLCLRSLIREHRQSVACSHLLHQDLRVSEIANKMGYADSTVFWRAFKTWTGTSPSRW